MSKQGDIVRLRHMLDAAKEAMEFAKSAQRSDLDTDRKLALSLVRLVEIIGEAAKQVSATSRELCPEIPWSNIAGTRDRLIHGYYDVDYDIIWRIVSADLADLAPKLEKLIDQYTNEK